MGRSSSDWDEDLQRLGSRAEDFFDRLLGLAATPRFGFEHAWRPAIDVYELDDSIMVVVELPGVDEADLSVTVQEGRLRIGGQRRLPSIERCKQPLQLEIQYGPFERVIPLPGAADAEQVSAQFRDGLLAVRVPLAATRQSIPVQSDDEGTT